MTAFDFSIRPYDPVSATEAELKAINVHENLLQTEAWPDNPPISVEEMLDRYRSMMSSWERQMWTAWLPHEEVAATASVSIRHDINPHLADFQLSVRPDLRRQGIGSMLLRRIVGFAIEKQRRSLITWGAGAVPAGGAFMERLGARMVLRLSASQLDITSVDPALITSWLQRSAVLAADFELGVWLGAYPEEHINSALLLYEARNTEPRDDMDVEDERPTIAQLREREAHLERERTERWTMYVRERTSGQFAGYTEVLWNHRSPNEMHQGDTIVLETYRNRGLGRWLKATMLQKVLRDRPEVTRIRTFNAYSNGPMLKINQELGFQELQSTYTWQVDIDKVQAYLESR